MDERKEKKDFDRKHNKMSRIGKWGVGSGTLWVRRADIWFGKARWGSCGREGLYGSEALSPTKHLPRDPESTKNS